MSHPEGLDRLHPVIVHHVVNTLGWPSLRPLQEQAIEPVMNGADVLLLAPTAGGKTEAAVLPLLSVMASGNWPATSVLYLCPYLSYPLRLSVHLSEKRLCKMD